MVQKLIRDIKLYNERMITMAGITVVLALLGFLGTAISLQGSISFGVSISSGAVAIAMFIYVLVGSGYYHQEAMLALSLGQTRRDFMVCFWLRELLWFAGAYLFSLLCYGIEWLVIALSAPAVETLKAFAFLFDWKFVLFGLPGLAMLSMFFGVLDSSFSKAKMIWQYAWIVYFAIRMLMYNEKVMAGFVAVVKWIVAVPAALWAVLGILAVLASIYATIRLGMKQTVR